MVAEALMDSTRTGHNKHLGNQTEEITASSSHHTENVPTHLSNYTARKMFVVFSVAST